MNSDQDSSAQGIESAMGEAQWLDYETLLMATSDFSDSSEVDGLLCLAWLAGEAIETAEVAQRYLRGGCDAQALARCADYLRRHARWVAQRCKALPDQLPAGIEPLLFSADSEATEWQLHFDPQLWLLGWNQGLEDCEAPEFNGDSRLDQAFELICMAAEETARLFDDSDLDQPMALPQGGDQADQESLLDLASPAELAISDGVSMALALIPRIIPMLRMDDLVAQDDLLFSIDDEVNAAAAMLASEADAAAMATGEGLFGARLAWVRGQIDRLPAAFHQPSDRGRLGSAEVEQIQSRWAAAIEVNGGLPFEYVDGFFSAYRVVPNRQHFDLEHRCYPLFADQAEALSEAQLRTVISDLESFSSHVLARGLMDDAVQLMGVPAQVDRFLDEDPAVGAGKLAERWSEGFRSGLAHFCEPIGDYLRQDKLLFALTLPLIQLSFQPEGMEYKFSLAERQELVAAIPETLNDIAERMHRVAHTPVRRTDKIGRNDPCPCGSGKKYKKCCGAS